MKKKGFGKQQWETDSKKSNFPNFGRIFPKKKIELGIDFKL